MRLIAVAVVIGLAATPALAGAAIGASSDYPQAQAQAAQTDANNAQAEANSAQGQANANDQNAQAQSQSDDERLAQNAPSRLHPRTDNDQPEASAPSAQAPSDQDAR